MNYVQQETYLAQSRNYGALVVLLLAAASIFAFRTVAVPRWTGVLPFVLATVALAVSLYYTPDYLHLSVDPSKRLRWAIRIRWRVVAAVLLAGAIAAPGLRSRMEVIAAALWLFAANLLARRVVPSRLARTWFAVTDLALMLALIVSGWLNFPLAGVLLALSAHCVIVISEKHPLLWASASTVACWLLIAASPVEQPSMALRLAGILVTISCLATGWLVARAQRQNAANVAAAMKELQEFAGYSEHRIRELWGTSNQQLARNWQAAAIAGDDREQLARWYCDNSELYLFAISAYNLECKRIRSNLKVLKFAQGSTLDYGAGNGELLLELARRGHPVTYYDVEGVTMRFARQRVERCGLKMDFYSTKEGLLAAARKKGFDTIFSFDVLEHLPDLPGELDFLAALLSAGGLLVFDVPAGSTKAHPMHLNHNLDVRAHLSARGLKLEQPFAQALSFRKEEKYFFRALPQSQ